MVQSNCNKEVFSALRATHTIRIWFVPYTMLYNVAENNDGETAPEWRSFKWNECALKLRA